MKPVSSAIIIGPSPVCANTTIPRTVNSSFSLPAKNSAIVDVTIGSITNVNSATTVDEPAVIVARIPISVCSVMVSEINPVVRSYNDALTPNTS